MSMARVEHAPLSTRPAQSMPWLGRGTTTIHGRPLRSFYSTGGASATPPPPPPQPQMSGFKRLINVYGRLGLIAYLGVSAVDYACCYLIVRAAGEKRVAVMEQWLREHLGRFRLFPTHDESVVMVEGTAPEVMDQADRVQDEAARERALERQPASSEAVSRTPSAATLLLVAYGLHKLIMPLRIAFTAIILPPMVKRFGHISWLVGKNAAKATRKRAAAAAGK
ncbi:hypothetical protein SYNPS1DRAFT_26438 [Syncephalis pseudoplumigaleata]|uniref:DUF1279 domain-containing protein n=1 Tax=Syncephalis pseudoplumigaleata TaxID=1712513 RepID=A0A4P9Z6Y0_9FUNG|nr:hypothetical protein SYNPS1DRAFT_26438 [Syncephalis pseudoplumigaleata]|eukprot:RKP27942.1 hypothetical protein SYNPS1DRAFT_26438 [Syncephalis pseudoplumigaleata]